MMAAMRGPMMGGGLFGTTTHGEFQSGAVTGISATSIEVTSTDGYVRTYTIDADTLIDNGNAQVDDITEQETRLGRESVVGNRHRPDGIELRWRSHGTLPDHLPGGGVNHIHRSGLSGSDPCAVDQHLYGRIFGAVGGHGRGSLV